MNSIRYLRSRPWALGTAAVVLGAVHVTVFHLFRHVDSRTVVSSAVVSGVVLLLIAKHLSVLGALLGSLYARFRRRPPSDIQAKAVLGGEMGQAGRLLTKSD